MVWDKVGVKESQSLKRHLFNKKSLFEIMMIHSSRVKYKNKAQKYCIIKKFL